MHLAKKTPAGSALGASGLVALGFSYGWHSEVRSFVMASVANGLKMGELITGSKHRLFWAVVAPAPQSPLGLLTAQVFVWFGRIGRPVPVPRLTPLRAAQAADHAPLGRTGIRVWVEEKTLGTGGRRGFENAG